MGFMQSRCKVYLYRFTSQQFIVECNTCLKTLTSEHVMKSSDVQLIAEDPTECNIVAYMFLQALEYHKKSGPVKLVGTLLIPKSAPLTFSFILFLISQSAT